MMIKIAVPVTARELNEWLFNASIYFYVANDRIMDLNIG